MRNAVFFAFSSILASVKERCEGIQSYQKHSPMGRMLPRTEALRV
jgi:hypothetical protein